MFPPWCRRSARQYEQLAERYLEADCLTIGPGVKTGMPIRIENPLEVGADRLVNAIAAYERFGEACVSVDFGTGINIDAVSADGEYLGGAIGPGLETLAQRPDRTGGADPQNRPRRAGEAIGRSTRAAIHSGFIFGFAGLIDGIVRRIEEELREAAGARHRRLRLHRRPLHRDDRRGRRPAYPEGAAPDPWSEHLNSPR